ncbi:MAG: tRNA (N6-threonylcarbamoyladenosine(37)-N6)-methyltransferase TrmO [Methanocorpusculum sp.]|nr:tRNA (N6-threonylcarbamoyladenosine(37)-N6)-methyltransferase TrmO [Methanocorpusculum sp.]
MDSITFSPIGIIHSPHKDLSGMPIQPPAAKEFEGTLEILPEFEEGLEGIDGFTRVMVFYHLHKSAGPLLTAKPFLDTTAHGVFATRIPRRPNALGFSVLRLISRDKNLIKVGDVDILDETPIIDIKPYVPPFDSYPDERYGWFEGKVEDIEKARSDERFKR